MTHATGVSDSSCLGPDFWPGQVKRAAGVIHFTSTQQNADFNVKDLLTLFVDGAEMGGGPPWEMSERPGLMARSPSIDRPLLQRLRVLWIACPLPLHTVPTVSKLRHIAHEIKQEGDGPIYEHATMVTVLSLIMRSNTQMGQIWNLQPKLPLELCAYC